MSSLKDDLDAVRVFVEALEPFSDEERARILRWASEKIGMGRVILNAPATAEPDRPNTQKFAADDYGSVRKLVDLKTFVNEKKPSNDVHFATTVSYYYAFEAPQSDRRTSIGSEDLQNACRLTGRPRLQNPGQTLRNASFRGFLDKAEERGLYRLNTVGENLVAVTLPGTPESHSTKIRSPSRKKATSKASKKKSVAK